MRVREWVLSMEVCAFDAKGAGQVAVDHVKCVAYSGPVLDLAAPDRWRDPSWMGRGEWRDGSGGSDLPDEFAKRDMRGEGFGLYMVKLAFRVARCDSGTDVSIWPVSAVLSGRARADALFPLDPETSSMAHAALAAVCAENAMDSDLPLAKCLAASPRL